MIIRDFFIYLFIMAGVTYLIRVLPFVIFKGKITNHIYKELPLLRTICCAWCNDIPSNIIFNW